MTWLHWLLAFTTIWAVVYFGPVFYRALFDPYVERFADVDELARRDISWCAVHSQPFLTCWEQLGTVTVERTCHG